MSNIGEDEQALYNQKYLKLIQDSQTLLISTVSAQGIPECSYAPYFRATHGVFYIFVSELAIHTTNMLDNNRASVMFIQPEKEAKNLFARERAVFDCSVVEIHQDEENYNSLLDIMAEILGETIGLLRSLPDFHFFQLIPVKGRYIAGFGQAFKINTTENVLEF